MANVAAPPDDAAPAAAEDEYVPLPSEVADLPGGGDYSDAAPGPVPTDVGAGLPAGRWRPNSKAALARYEDQLRSSVTVKPFTVIAEEAIPPPPQVEVKRRHGPAWLSFAHANPDYERALIEEQVARAAAMAASYEDGPPPTKLDGFLLLENTAAELPDQATRVTLSERNIVDAEQEDLEFFSRLAFMDLGDNRLPMELLKPLPALVELRLHCNALRHIGDLAGGFVKLEVLDLSYNALEADAVGALGVLPNLRELDLTCNALTALPADFAAFRRLEVLILERNRLEADESLVSLSQAPHLRELNLSYNYFRRMPREACAGAGFRTLEWLNLAHNYISVDTDILPLVKLPRLLQVILYGNPLTEGTAPPREDPATDEDAGGLNEEETEGRVVNLVTDPPDPKAKRLGKGAYSNFRITKVVDNTIPSATAWREAGNKYLFGESDSEDEGDATRAPVELQDGEGDTEGAAAAAEGKEKEARARKPRGDEKTTIFLTADNDDTGVSVDSDEEGEGGAAGAGADELTISAILLKRSLEGDPRREVGDPARLRAAVNALRHVLKHPMTSHVGAGDGGGKKHHFEQTTTIQKLRQRPIKPYVVDKTKRSTGGGGGHTSQSVSRHYLRGIGAETDAGGEHGSGPAAVRRAEAETNKSLAAMEDMLDRMNGRMSAVEAELSTAMAQDESMSLLMNMVGSVMETYE